MTDWFSQHGIEFAAFVLTLVVTVVGWVVEHKSSKERNKDREEDIKLLREQLDASNATVSTLRDQVRALESQADAQLIKIDFGNHRFLGSHYFGFSLRFMRRRAPTAHGFFRQ